MFRVFLLILFINIVPSHLSVTTPTGSIELDEYSFDKITNKFNASLVKFDISYPFGDKHEIFVAFAIDAKDSEELLIAEVGVKDYGKKNNEALAKKYGVSKEDFPVIKLFVKGQPEPINFDTSESFTSDDLRSFIRNHTGIFLSLPGCSKELDLKAIKFMQSKTDDRTQILKEVTEIVEKLPDKEKSVENIYKNYMVKILEKGDEFIKNEFARLTKLANEKLSDKKKNHLTLKQRILHTFEMPSFKKPAKEEL